MRTSFLLLSCVLLLGCGGGGGGGEAPASYLSGWWALAMPPSTSPQPRVLAGPANHQGDAFTYLGMRLVLDGDALTGAEPDYESPNRTEWHLTVLSEDRIEGTLHGYTDGTPTDLEDIVLIRAPPPSGVLTAEGTLDGAPVDLQSSTAYALVAETPAAGGGQDYDVSLVDMHPDGSRLLGLHFSLPAVWASPRVLQVTEDVTGGLVLSDRVGSATDGVVTLMRFEANRIQGEYEMVLGPGDSIQGTFDMPILDRY